MPTVAYVAEQLGLPGNRFITVNTYCNKNQFRNLCDKVHVPCPRHVAVAGTNFNERGIDIPLPWIVKPADSQSSIGIKKIEHEEELLPALQVALKRSPTHTAIVEEFFEGRELVCEGYINEGKYYLLMFGDRRYFELKDVMIPSQTLFPSTVDAELQQRIVSYEQALAKASKPSFAIVHSEYLVNETSGEIRVVESALRGGGVYISSDLIPMATGIDINEVILSRALDKNVDVDEVFRNRSDKASAYVCFYLHEGTITSVEGAEDVKALPFVRKAYLDGITVGSRTKKPDYKGARKGPILVQGENRIDLEKNIDEVQSLLKIDIITDEHETKSVVWK